MTAEDVDYEVNGVPLRGYLAHPGDVTPRPALLIAHEATGLSEHCRTIARRAAELGYIALALDYIGDGRTIADPEVIWRNIAEWQTDPKDLRQRIRAAHELLLETASVDRGRIAGLGYCFGGQALVEYARTGADLVAIVGFHSGMSVNRLRELRAIKAKLLMCQGGADPITSREQRLAFEDEMQAAGVDWRMLVIGGAGHSFTNPDADKAGIEGVRYSASADRASWRGACLFLAEHGV